MEQAEAGLVNKGFEYRERRNSSGQELVVVGDPELANRVQECRSSITRHQEQKKNTTILGKGFLNPRLNVTPKQLCNLSTTTLSFLDFNVI